MQQSFLTDNQTSIFNVSGRTLMQEEAQNNGYAEILEIVTQQNRQIEKLEGECNRMHLVVNSLARSSQSAVSLRRMSIGSVPDASFSTKDVNWVGSR
jgi:hypothetical protein